MITAPKANRASMAATTSGRTRVVPMTWRKAGKRHRDIELRQGLGPENGQPGDKQVKHPGLTLVSEGSLLYLFARHQGMAGERREVA